MGYYDVLGFRNANKVGHHCDATTKLGIKGFNFQVSSSKDTPDRLAQTRDSIKESKSLQKTSASKGLDSKAQQESSI